jgi:hypothetical protein
MRATCRALHVSLTHAKIVVSEQKRYVKIGYDAGDVKKALLARYPAKRQGSFVGRWTCLTEWAGIDLLALDAWQAANVVGHEVKVSRGDLRSELLSPTKRMEAVSRCTEFYIATPAGLLKPDELEFNEPDWTLSDFERERCPGIPERKLSGHRYRTIGGQCTNPRVDLRGRARRYVSRDTPKGYTVKVPLPVVIDTTGMGTDPSIPMLLDEQGFGKVVCPRRSSAGKPTQTRCATACSVRPSQIWRAGPPTAQILDTRQMTPYRDKIGS